MRVFADGYSIHPDVFSRTEMRQIAAVFETANVSRTRAGARHLLGVPEVASLAVDPRLLALARSYLGGDPMPFRATLFDKSAGSNWLVAWHQDLALPLVERTDDPGWGPWSTKLGVLYAIAPASALECVVALRVHLDDSNGVNGPLRVLPGTHRRGVLDDGEVSRLAKVIQPVDCLCDAGGVVAMRPLSVHASSKASDDRPRRVLHIEYATSLYLAAGVQLAIA